MCDVDEYEIDKKKQFYERNMQTYTVPYNILFSSDLVFFPLAYFFFAFHECSYGNSTMEMSKINMNENI